MKTYTIEFSTGEDNETIVTTARVYEIDLNENIENLIKNHENFHSEWTITITPENNNKKEVDYFLADTRGDVDIWHVNIDGKHAARFENEQHAKLFCKALLKKGNYHAS